MHTAKALDTVVANGEDADETVNLSAGVITANLRTDAGHIRSVVKGERVDTGRTKLGAIIGPGAFIGIGAMLMPGVKIGARTIVGPTTLVHNDVPEKTLFYAEQAYVSKPLPDVRDE
jgi:acetyltransferase-like isoleucine patch superfamily enzyme